MNHVNKLNTEQVLNRIQKTRTSNHDTATSVQNQYQPSFTDVLNRVKGKDDVKFSKHAIQRLQDRNIELSQGDVNRINEGLSKAKTKGVRDALILMDNKVFVASVLNNTIITAAVDEQLKENVFTNIDGAVIV